MEEYRRKLKMQNIIFLLGTAVLIAVQIVAYSGIISPAEVPDKRWADFWNGFYAGISMGVTFIFILGFIINLRAMRSEKALKKLFIKENDERKREICEKGKSAGASAYAFCMLAAAIVGGYFNITICITLIAATLGLSLFMIAGKLYYSKKL